MSKLKYRNLDKEIEIEDPESSILDVSIREKIAHLHECGGHGLCTTCRVRVWDGLENLSERKSREQRMADLRDWDSRIRLACQTRVLKGSVTVEPLIKTSSEVSQLSLETIPTGIGEERLLAFLFCDMRDFTSMAETHPNFDIAHILNRFFTALGDPVFLNNGIIYQYAGDELVALFGTGDESREEMCMNALRAAIAMTYAIDELNVMEFNEFDLKIRVGIGLHFGKSFVGNIGHPRHKQFAVIGDPVNVTSRIQSKNKDLGTTILASSDLIRYIPSDLISLGKESEVELKGKEGLQSVREVIGFRNPDQTLEVQASIGQLLKDEEAFASLFYDKVFQEAPEVRELFQKNMVEQGKMLTHMLRGIVYALSRPSNLYTGLHALGNQHKGYGVLPEHYDLVRRLLLETISETLEDQYTESMQKSWEATIDFVISYMKTA